MRLQFFFSFPQINLQWRRGSKQTGESEQKQQKQLCKTPRFGSLMSGFFHQNLQTIKYRAVWMWCFAWPPLVCPSSQIITNHNAAKRATAVQLCGDIFGRRNENRLLFCRKRTVLSCLYCEKIFFYGDLGTFPTFALGCTNRSPPRSLEFSNCGNTAGAEASGSRIPAQPHFDVICQSAAATNWIHANKPFPGWSLLQQDAVIPLLTSMSSQKKIKRYWSKKDWLSSCSLIIYIWSPFLFQVNKLTSDQILSLIHVIVSLLSEFKCLLGVVLTHHIRPDLQHHFSRLHREFIHGITSRNACRWEVSCCRKMTQIWSLPRRIRQRESLSKVTAEYVMDID